MNDFTNLLQKIETGENCSGDLLPLVYDELRKLAAIGMADQAAGHTLPPTDLLHEVWIRPAGKDAATPFANRAHFFAAAAAVRRILINSGWRMRRRDILCSRQTSCMKCGCVWRGRMLRHPLPTGLTFLRRRRKRCAGF